MIKVVAAPTAGARREVSEFKRGRLEPRCIRTEILDVNGVCASLVVGESSGIDVLGSRRADSHSKLRVKPGATVVIGCDHRAARVMKI